MEKGILEVLSENGINFPNGEAVLNSHKYKKISVLDVLAGPLSNDLASCSNNDEAQQMVLNTMEMLDNLCEGHKQYNKLGPKTRLKMKAEMRGKSPFQILFYITNSSQKGAGVGLSLAQ